MKSLRDEVRRWRMKSKANAFGYVIVRRMKSKANAFGYVIVRRMKSKANAFGEITAKAISSAKQIYSNEVGFHCESGSLSP